MSEKSKGVFAGVATILASFGVVVEHPQVLKVFNPIEEVVEHPQVFKVFKPIEKVVEEIHSPNVRRPSLPDINEPTISKLVPPASSAYNEAIKQIRTVAKDAAFEYVYKNTNEISFDAVRQAAFDAARKQNELQGNILPNKEIVLIATSVATLAYHERVSPS